ncbi:MAG: protein DA1 [Gammaproteobacteria bacterium]|nr:protein DA1 [Gammaproteobacteria bacterium]
MFKKRLVCQQCKKDISSDYLQALGGYWHPECFTCTACNKPFKNNQFVLHNKKPYHKNCYQQQYSPRCNVCDKAMEGKYIKDLWGHQYCADHKKKLPTCSSCHRLISPKITGGGHKLKDGRVICSMCQPTAISANDQIDRCMSQVQKFLTQFKLSLTCEQYKIELVSQKHLKKLTKHWSVNKGHTKTSAEGLTQTNVITQGKKEVSREVKKVLILYGLPREHFTSVLAHEMFHVWLFVNRFPKLPLKVEEGLCTLIEFLYLSSQRTDTANMRMKQIQLNKDKIYGTGFRTAYKFYRSSSLGTLLNYVKNNGKFPNVLSTQFW